MGLSLFILMLTVNIVQVIFSVIVSVVAPAAVASSWFLLINIFISLHVVGLAVFFLLMKPKGAQPVREKKTISPLRFVKLFIMCMGVTYLFNFVSLGINALIGLLKHSPVTNPLATVVSGSNLVLQILIVAVSAPIVEELIFRKLLLDRLRPYGDRVAIWVSALAFALFHGNLSQALYAFVLGLIFAYIMIRTNNILYSMVLHVIVNLFGSAIMPLLAMSGSPALTMVAGLLVWVFLIVGIIFFIMELKHIELREGEITLPRSERFKTCYLNVGMILYFIICLALFVVSIFI